MAMVCALIFKYLTLSDAVKAAQVPVCQVRLI